MKGLVVQNPWAWCIGRAAVDPAAKTVENRGWQTTHRGDLAIITGKAVDPGGEFDQQVQATINRWAYMEDRDMAVGPWPWDEPTGAVTAVVDLYSVCDWAMVGWAGPCDCQPWARPGQYHHRYRNVRLLPEPVPVRGFLGIRHLPFEVAAAVRAQLAGVRA